MRLRRQAFCLNQLFRPLKNGYLRKIVENSEITIVKNVSTGHYPRSKTYLQCEMSKSNVTMISDEAALVGKSLDNVFAHFADRAASSGAALVDLESTKFRKKDLPLSQGVKSTLKHRIQTATGRQFKEIEEELGYSQGGSSIDI